MYAARVGSIMKCTGKQLGMSDPLFRAAFRRYGEPWRVPDEESEDAKVSGCLLQAFRSAVSNQRRAIGPKGPIYCDLILNPSFNAMATVEGQHEFVTLFSGAINLIYTAYFDLLSDPRSLPCIGDPSHESVPDEAVARLRASVGRYRPNHLPKDAQRAQAARDLALLTCLFILLHEVGHIVGGHPVFIQRHGMAVYEEIPLSSISENQSRIHLACEWAADQYAASASYQTARLILGNPEGFPALAPLHPDLVWGICAAMTFILIGYFTGGLRLSSVTHPCSLYQYVWATVTVGEDRECQRFAPDAGILGEGFGEVGTWFERNNLKLAGGRPFVREMTDLKRVYGEYLSVRETFLDESELLSAIETERRLGADAWRKNNHIN